MGQIENAWKIIVPTAILFVTIILCLAVRPEKLKKVIAKMLLVVAVSALFLYGYGYANQTGSSISPPVSVLRATIDVLRVFVGSNNWDMVKSAYPEPYQQAAFWLLHLVALCTSASAVVTSLGSRLIRRVRLRLLRMWDITVIYGLSDQTLEFGRELMRQGVRSILYVERNPEQGSAAAVDHLGCVLRSDGEALAATAKFLRSIGVKPGKRKIHVYALSRDMIQNRQYAECLLHSLEKRRISPENSTLTIFSQEEEGAARFLRSDTRYGFGSVLSVNEPELVARLLVKTYPPCDVISFDDQGNARNDFHAVVIGFGRIGQAVLKQLVTNGQFCANRFRLAVFAPNYSQTMGLLAHECDGMLENYDITFHAGDGRSCELYDYLSTHRQTVNYIAVCTGNHGLNLEIAEQLRSFLERRHQNTAIYMCSSTGVYHHGEHNRMHMHKIYTPQILCSDQIDRMAMVLHHHYTRTGTMEENWKNCDYFNRVSSRSAADFYPAILRAAGSTVEDAKKHWDPQGPLLENLAKMEHLRWNAFHYAMGFRPMPDEVYQDRVQRYLQARKADPSTSYRIARDMDLRLHGCLIPWEELDGYSRKENAVTGENRDYRNNDRENIRAIRDVLLAMDET